MHETQHAVEHVRERAHRLFGAAVAQRGLAELDVHVGELAPYESLERGEVFAEKVPVDEARAILDDGLGAGEDPARILAGCVGPLIGRSPA